VSVRENVQKRVLLVFLFKKIIYFQFVGIIWDRLVLIPGSVGLLKTF